MILRYAQAILVKLRCGCVIVQGNDSVFNCSGEWLQEQYWKHQPIKPTINQLRPINWATKNEQLIQERSDCSKASNLSESGQIATDLTKEQLTEYENEYKYRQRSEVWDLDQGLKVWNRPGTWSRPRRPWKFRKFRRFI